MEMNPYHPLITARRRPLLTVPRDALDLPADMLVELTRLLPEVRTYRLGVLLSHPLDATVLGRHGQIWRTRACSVVGLLARGYTVSGLTQTITARTVT